MAPPLRPGQLKPNEFELAILRRLAIKEPSISGIVERLHVLSREFTGVGSNTKFKCDDSSGGTRARQIGLDELISIPGVPNGMGAVLSLKGVGPECLEIYSRSWLAVARLLG